MRPLLFGGALALALGSAAAAHSPVSSTAPADGAVAAEAPTAIAITFSAPVRLTKVSLIAEAGGAATDLDLSDAGGFAQAFTMPCETAGAGGYKVVWRALAQDGHAMTGDFRFDVK